jgi:hypothetical protein
MTKNTKTNNIIKVINVLPKGKKATREYTQEIKHFTRLGKEIRVSPKANSTINNFGFSIKFYTESVDVLIGIGKDYTADLIMDIDAWKALNSGEKIHITTTEDFKKKYVYKK